MTMSVLIFALIVVIIACLVIYGLRFIPGIPSPLNWTIPLIVIIIAVVVIEQRAGLLG